jgi:hypothetical protein
MVAKGQLYAEAEDGGRAVEMLKNVLDAGAERGADRNSVEEGKNAITE